MFDEEYERVIHPRRVGDIYLYTVRPGDNVYRIARNFNTKIEWIACMNKLDQQMMIYPDQQLYIPFYCLKDQCQWYNQEILMNYIFNGLDFS